MTSTFSNIHSLDRLLLELLERFGGKGGGGLALEVPRRRDNLPNVWDFYLPRSSPNAARTARIVKPAPQRGIMLGTNICLW